MAEQTGGMKATEMIHLGALCELVDLSQGFRILVPAPYRIQLW